MKLHAQVIAAACVLGSVWASGKTVEDVQKEALPPFELVARLSAFEGDLLGFDGGEWGGQLVFLNSAGDPQIVLNTNIRGVVRDGDGIFVFTGLAHITLNFGAIWELARTADGAVVATKLLELPGQPDAIQELGDLGVAFVTFKGFDKKNKPVFECLRLHRRRVDESKECVVQQ